MNNVSDYLKLFFYFIFIWAHRESNPGIFGVNKFILKDVLCKKLFLF
jgi:hypothetical protein